MPTRPGACSRIRAHPDALRVARRGEGAGGQRQGEEEATLQPSGELAEFLPGIYTHATITGLRSGLPFMRCLPRRWCLLTAASFR